MKNIFKIIYRSIAKNVDNKKKKLALSANEYLEKFNYNIDCQKEKIGTNSNYIWQLWNQGEDNAPPIVKKCFDSVKKFNPKKEIVVVDDNSIDRYITINPVIKEKYQKGIISKANFSDYVRTCLLIKYGGIWIDSTVLLTDKIPDLILNQDFFVFKNQLWFNHKKVPSDSLFKLFLSIDKDFGLYGSSWFIVAKSNNPILILLKHLFEEYWTNENKLIYYFLFHLFLSKIVIKNQLCSQIFENMYSLSNKEPHILQSLLSENFDKNIFEEIKKLSSIHKLTYKFDKIKQNSYLEYILKEEH